MPTNLRPASTLSAVVLPATGTHSDVASDLAYGIYNNSSFVSGAVDQVAYVYNKLGGNILDLEITPKNVYNAYEEACLEYSYLINTHQAKNVLSDLMGNTTGTFNTVIISAIVSSLFTGTNNPPAPSIIKLLSVTGT